MTDKPWKRANFVTPPPASARAATRPPSNQASATSGAPGPGTVAAPAGLHSAPRGHFEHCPAARWRST